MPADPVPEKPQSLGQVLSPRQYRLKAASAEKSSRRKTAAFVLYLCGIGLSVALVLRLPLGDVAGAFEAVGPGAAFLLLVPASWVILDAVILRILLKNNVPLRKALYAQLTGDAFNGLTPLLGVGGEPYKAAYLASFSSLDASSHAVLQSRLINALSGLVFTIVIVAVSLVIVDFSNWPGLSLGLGSVAAAMAAAAGALAWLVMSRVPSRLSGFFLAKCRLVEELRYHKLSWSDFWITMGLKMAGRGGKFLELYLIFLVLDLSPSLADVVLVEALLMASVSTFFFIPQGMGVGEVGIVTAFGILGYSAVAGVAYGLIRRARMLSYTLVGLFVYLVGSCVVLYKRRRRQRPSRD